MKGLLLKDWYTLIKQMKIMLVLSQLAGEINRFVGGDAAGDGACIRRAEQVG